MASTPNWTDGPCVSVSKASSPGRIRTVDPLFVRQVPSPLGHGTVFDFQSAMRESNPPIQLGRLAPQPIGQWHIFILLTQTDAEHRQQESNLRRVSSQVVNSHPLTPTSAHRYVRHFKPTLSCLGLSELKLEKREMDLNHRPPGYEPGELIRTALSRRAPSEN